MIDEMLGALKTDLFLKPGELVVTAYPKRITTILGTCIAVVLYDPIKKMGGMNHYMLPRWNGLEKHSLKYGNIAIKTLIDEMVLNGAKKDRMVAGVYGGADKINSVFRIGFQNTMIALEMLNAQKIEVIKKNTGGVFGRRIRFSIPENHVVVNHLN